MSKIDAILLDVDGTLWDSVPAVHQAWREGLEQKGYHYDIGLEQMKALFGEQVDTFGDVLFSDLPVEQRRALAHELADEQIDKMRESKLFHVYPGVRETLEKLSQTYPLYIVTNAKEGYAELFLEISQTEDFIVECQHAVPGKSKGDNIREVMARHNLKHVIYVGDTAMDQRESQEAGARFIWAAYGFGGEVENDLVIDGFDQLPERLTEI